jgi:hypothetical protein
MKMAQFRPKLSAMMLLGVALLATPENLFCQSKTTASARLYIRVNVVPVLRSEAPAQPKQSSATITFDLTSQAPEFDRQVSTREAGDQTGSSTPPIVLNTVTVTPK